MAAGFTKGVQWVRSGARSIALRLLVRLMSRNPLKWIAGQCQFPEAVQCLHPALRRRPNLVEDLRDERGLVLRQEPPIVNLSHRRW